MSETPLELVKRALYYGEAPPRLSRAAEDAVASLADAFTAVDARELEHRQAIIAATAALMLTGVVPNGAKSMQDAVDAVCLALATAQEEARRHSAARVRANNLLATFRDHAFLPEVLENDVEEIDAYLTSALARGEAGA